MRKKLALMLAVSTLLIGCGSVDVADTDVSDEEVQQTHQETEDQSSRETEDQTQVEEVVPHTHTYTEAITTAVSCETDGEKLYTCECGDSYTEVIVAIGHIYENYISNNDATYLADGTETAVCNGCELTDTRIVEGSKLEYTYAELDKTMYAKQSVNVRDLPTVDGNKLGGLSHAQEVKVLGQCNETSWYKIAYDGSVAYVSNNYLVDEKPVQQTVEESPSGSTSGNTYMLDGMELEYGVMYLNVCGHNLTGERVLSKSQGPFPYPLGQLIDNGDGTYTVYTIGSHGYFLDGQFYIHDTSATTDVWHSLELQGYSVSYAGGSSWHACVGGYDEGCIKKLVVTK